MKGRPKGSGQYSKNYKLRLSEDQKDKLEKMAEKRGTTSADILRELIEKAFNKGE